MHGSELKDGQHSTPEPDPRPSLFPRVMFSLAIVGLMVGLMIGKLTNPEVLELVKIEEQPAALVLWFTGEPKVQSTTVDGALVVQFQAHGLTRNGQVDIDGKKANWRTQPGQEGLLLNVVAARPLQGDISGEKEDGRWRLKLSLREE